MLLRSALGLGLTVLSMAACSSGGGGGTSPTIAPVTPSPSPSPSPTPGPATIMQTASTNRQPYTIVVAFDGSATITVDNGSPTTGTVPSATTAQFFSDLNANAPVTNIMVYSPCTKSSSFGTSTTVTYGGYTTGDISCPAPASPAPVTTVYNDVKAVESALGTTSE